MKRVLLFDLDETLMVEKPAADAAFAAVARYAAGHYDVDAETLASNVPSRARELWHAAPTHDYCMRVGISSWEGLWCRFEGRHPDIRVLHRWSSTYRSRSWQPALADQGVEDPRLADELAERFGVERRGRHEVFADVAHALDRLVGSHPMALVTNGAACLQREKLAASGLSEYFQTVVVSPTSASRSPIRPFSNTRSRRSASIVAMP